MLMQFFHGACGLAGFGFIVGGCVASNGTEAAVGVLILVGVAGLEKADAFLAAHKGQESK